MRSSNTCERARRTATVTPSPTAPRAMASVTVRDRSLSVVASHTIPDHAQSVRVRTRRASPDLSAQIVVSVQSILPRIARVVVSGAAVPARRTLKPPTLGALSVYERRSLTISGRARYRTKTADPTCHACSSQAETAFVAMVRQGLEFQRAEIARLTGRLATAPPGSRFASLLRTTLKFHKDMIARAGGSVQT